MSMFWAADALASLTAIGAPPASHTISATAFISSVVSKRLAKDHRNMCRSPGFPALVMIPKARTTSSFSALDCAAAEALPLSISSGTLPRPTFSRANWP